MYAIIETGTKQYLVETGQKIKVEKLPGNPGDTVTLDRVLLYKNNGTVSVGKPYLEQTKVTGKIMVQDKGPKVVTRKYRAKKGYRRTIGHRQPYTELLIQEIK